MSRRIDGRQVAAIFVGGFAVVIGVNLYAAVLAKQTFGGIVVENSYVASQKYNGWLQQAADERALGWSASPRRLADDRIAVELDGVPAGATVEGMARHPLGRQPDIALGFDANGVSREALPPGRWIVRLSVSADGKRSRSESVVQ